MRLAALVAMLSTCSRAVYLEGFAQADVDCAACLAVADELRPALLARIREELPKGVPHLYELTDDELDLRPLMRDEMRALPCAEFERVLHPVFEEDELTLILIGTALGGIAGAAQALHPV